MSTIVSLVDGPYDGFLLSLNDDTQLIWALVQTLPQTWVQRTDLELPPESRVAYARANGATTFAVLRFQSP